MAKAIVVIENDVDMRDLIRFVLEPELELRIVGETGTAEHGVALVERNQPELVILNHYLDGDTRGLDVAGALKEAAPQAKVLLFSSFDLTIEASREAAVDAFLNKRRLTSLLPTVSELLDLAS